MNISTTAAQKSANDLPSLVPKDISASPAPSFSHIHKYISFLLECASLCKTLWSPMVPHRKMTTVIYIPIPTRQATNFVPAAEQVWDQEEDNENYNVYLFPKFDFLNVFR